MGYRVAVVGATGNVGREILSILSEGELPVDEVAAVASSSSVGKEVSYGDFDVLKCKRSMTLTSRALILGSFLQDPTFQPNTLPEQQRLAVS